MSVESYTLPEEFTIAEVSDAYSQLRKFIDPSLEIQLEIDASLVSRVDTAAVQMLFIVQKNLEHVGKTIHWQGMSQTFRDALAMLGMTQCFAISE